MTVLNYEEETRIRRSGGAPKPSSHKSSAVNSDSPGKESRYLKILIVDQQGQSWPMKIKPSAKMGSVLTVYVLATGADIRQRLRFRLYDRPVDLMMTADQMGLRDGAEVEVYEEMVGGGSKAPNATEED